MKPDKEEATKGVLRNVMGRGVAPQLTTATLKLCKCPAIVCCMGNSVFHAALCEIFQMNFKLA